MPITVSVSGFLNAPKIIHGAFVEYGLSIPPLFVLFQFNPVQLQRTRSLAYSVPNAVVVCPTPTETGEAAEMRRMERARSLRDWHKEQADLTAIRDGQMVRVQEETLNFELRLDATDALNDGNVIAQEFGIAPQLATLELMTYPKEESLLGAALGSLLGGTEGFSFTRSPNPPLILFIWGIQRILPVNINSLSITETEFDTMLNPIRATVGVNLTVIEGENALFKFSKTAKEVMSVLNLADLVVDIAIPG
jgi:Contractile injection system tube protein